MAHTDQIADMLTRVRNATMAMHKSVDVPSSNLKEQIAKILTERGYIKKYVVLGDNKQGLMKILLNEVSANPIKGIQRVSRPGRRIYKSASDMPRVLNGLGIMIVSTSKGVMTDNDCRKTNMGGELLCKVW